MNNPTDNPLVESLIRDFIAQNILFSENGFPHSDEASLLEEGIIDSLGVIELVHFVQTTFDVKVEQSELRPEHFESVARLAAFVRRKTATASLVTS
ncbi:MAG: acyl carrier protein [Verrucomicrobia bacterium]|mgnify:FL=1|nr:acyl carrier protein [Verrucomicrobiota bacterium]